jgi:hypothetical protein
LHVPLKIYLLFYQKTIDFIDKIVYIIDMDMNRLNQSSPVFSPDNYKI